MSKYITELANDIAKSCPDLVENGCGNDNCVACLAFKLTGLGYRKQEWISVDDRLPENKQMVLTIDTQGEMQVCFYETAWEGIFQQFHGLVKIFNITHWMPLPEAPKMKG